METEADYSVPKYASISWPSYLKMQFDLLLMPLYLTFEVLISPFVRRSRQRPLKRILGDTAFRYVSDYLTIPRLQYFFASSLAYKAWTKRRKLDTLVEELPLGNKIIWIGPKRTDKVILNIHGGAFLFAMQDLMISFWRWVQLGLEKKDVPVGLAFMTYSLVPVGVFPTQLQQAKEVIEYLLEQGVQPHNLQIVGDSAGANLISQVLSHMLHPIPSIAPLVLPPNTRIRGIYMMSPWVSLTDESDSVKSNDDTDIVGRRTMLTWGKAVLANVQESHMIYLEPEKAPEGWYDGLESIVDRVLVTTGEWECSRDSDALFFEKHIKPNHQNAEFIIQSRGVHDDPHIEFLLADKPFCSNTLAPQILEWVATGFDA